MDLDSEAQSVAKQKLRRVKRARTQTLAEGGAGDDGRLGRAAYPASGIFMRWHKTSYRLPCAVLGNEPRTRSSGASYAGCRIRTSENAPSTHSGE